MLSSRIHSKRNTIAAVTAALCSASLLAAPGITPAFAQQTVHKAVTTTHPKNWAQKHPTLTAIGAGIATHHALKVAARNAKLHHKKLNWAERHPTLSAIGVGATTHHIIKKTTH